MPRATKPSPKARHDPLHVQLDEDDIESKYGKISQPGKRKKSRKSQGDDEENGEVRLVDQFSLTTEVCIQQYLKVILDPKTSRRIFELAKDQQEEFEMPDDQIQGENPAFTTPRVPIPDDEDEDQGVGSDMEDNVEETLVRSDLSMRESFI